jgi:hypothetical protein
MSPASPLAIANEVIERRHVRWWHLADMATQPANVAARADIAK